MAIIPMKRLEAVIPSDQRVYLFKKLISIGCLEIIESDRSIILPEWTDRLKGIDSDPTDTLVHSNAVKRVLSSMDKFCRAKESPLFPQLRSISLQELDNPDLIKQTVEKAEFLNHINEKIDACHAEEGHILSRRLSLVPWKNLDVPLDPPNFRHVSVQFGVCPANADVQNIQDRLLEKAPESSLKVVGSDKEQLYLLLLVHRSQESESETILKDFGFTRVTFNGFHGTATQNIAECDRKISEINIRRNSLESEFSGLGEFRSDLELCFDALNFKGRQEETFWELLKTSRTLFLEGWVPEDRVNSVAKELTASGCAYEFSDPRNEDEPPVAFQSIGLTAPFSIISSLYGTPRYRSVIDPTPFMAPFFFIFFGMMVSDAAYGIILALTAVWVLRQVKQNNFLRKLFILVFYCGISTMLWGILFGSWFGDIVPTVSKMLTGNPITIRPLWFDPLKQPMDLLLFSFALGGIQILVGLGLSGWRKIRSGRWLDAVFDVGFWYLILIGLVTGLLDLPYGFEMAAAGAAGVVLTAGRKERNPLKRFIIGILSLYSVTGYLSDVLSYSRLLALGLASAVIASVVNAMGTIGGKSLGGIIALIFISIFGHLFNLAINLVGAYVHASRLQYVEFFSKFYEGGGKPFSPFAVETKYVHIQKQE